MEGNIFLSCRTELIRTDSYRSYLGEISSQRLQQQKCSQCPDVIFLRVILSLKIIETFNKVLEYQFSLMNKYQALVFPFYFETMAILPILGSFLELLEGRFLDLLQEKVLPISTGFLKSDDLLLLSVSHTKKPTGYFKKYDYSK